MTGWGKLASPVLLVAAALGGVLTDGSAHAAGRQAEPPGLSPICGGTASAPRFAMPTRLVRGPFALRITAPDGPYFVLLFRLNREPLSCETNTRGTFSLGGLLDDDSPSPLTPSARERARHRYCYVGYVRPGGQRPRLLSALLHAREGAGVRVALRPYTRRADGSTGLAEQSIRRTVPLRFASAQKHSAKAYHDALAALDC